MSDQDPKTGRFLPGNKAGTITRFKKNNLESTKHEAFTMTEGQKDAVVQGMACGLSLAECAKLVISPFTGKPISPMTLKRRMGPRLDQAVAQRKAEIMEKCYAKAMDDGNKDQGNMLRFLARVQVGLSEKAPNINITQKGGDGSSPVLMIGVTGVQGPTDEEVREHLEDDCIEGEIDGEHPSS